MKIMQRALTLWVLTSLFLQSCANIPFASTPTSMAEPYPATPTFTPEPPVSLTFTAPTLPPIPSLTPTLLATEPAGPTPGPIRPTPATLMLHRRNAKFDSVQFLQDFIAVLKANAMEVTTYRALDQNPELIQAQSGKLVILTIDDLYLRYPIDASVLEMINLLVDAGYPAVLGVVTESDYAYPETVATLRKLQSLGWEIASHSDTHRNLAAVEKVAPKSVYPEIKASLDKLERNFDLRPITLILPEGQMTRGDEQIKRSGVRWVIGINGGTEYDTRDPYFYLGREGPDGTAQATFAIMLKRFNP